MKTKGLVIVGMILVLLACFGSCDVFQGLFPAEGTAYGSLTIHLGKSRSTTVLPEYDLILDTFTVEGLHAAGHTFEKTRVPESELVIDSIPTGRWEITITGFNRDGVAIYAGSAAVEVDHTDNSVTVHIDIIDALLTGSGRIRFTLVTEEDEFDSPEITWLLTDREGNTVRTHSLMHGTEALFDKTLPSGTYHLAAEVYDSERYWKGNPLGIIVLDDITSQSEYVVASEMIHERTACSPPTVDNPSGEYFGVAVTLTADPGCLIRYTLDGTEPGEGNGELYTSPIRISSPKRMRAIACPEATDITRKRSTEIEEIYTISGSTAVAPVTFSIPPGIYFGEQLVYLSTVTGGCEIRYTINGANPSPGFGTVYESDLPIAVTSGAAVEIRAVAIQGSEVSEVAVRRYQVTGKVSNVESTVASGTYHTAQTVRLSTADAEATIRYTTDGTYPSEENGLPYAGDIVVDSPSMILAAAFRDGFTPSDLLSLEISLAPGVVEDQVAAGKPYKPEQLTLACETAGATIYYTTDGTDPSFGNGYRYEQGKLIDVDETVVVKAVAFKRGWDYSEVYVLNRAELGSGGPAGGYIFYDDAIGWDSSGNGVIEDLEKDLLDGVHDGILNGPIYLEAAPPEWYSEQDTENLFGGEDPDLEWGVYRRGSIGQTARGYAIGAGKTNTGSIVAYHDALVDAATGDPYYENPDLFTTHTYNDGSVAAKACADSDFGGVSDWYLPSSWEFARIRQVLYAQGIGGFDSVYWTSRESSDNYAYTFDFGSSGATGLYAKKDTRSVRPIRMF